LWVQALSVRVFGFHPLSLLVPQALMGMVAVGLIYDLVRRRFGRAGGFIAGFVLATTPIAVAISRHNNPDELLVLCSVAALWFAVRALETRRTRWLVFSGIAVGLGFETKMAVALMVVPGIAAAWMWTSSPGGRARLRALRQLLAGGLAMVVVGGAWPLLVTLTPASDRPWISGTSDNTIWSLIFGYNGLGRLAGQTGGPPGAGPGGIGPGGGGANVTFGGNTGPLRLLHTGLGDQAGWLLGFALVAGLGLLVASRLRRADSRTGWLIIVGGAFLTTAVAFSVASGIFHPYYVSLLAPFTAALVGAGAAMMLPGQPRARIMAPLALLAGAVTELIVLSYMGGSLPWARPLVIVVGGACAIALAFELTPRLRVALVAAGLVALLAAPATWAAQTLGHATNGTFPAGGPANAAAGGFGGPGGPGRFGGRHRFSPPGSGTAQLGAGTASGQAGLPSGSGTPGALSPGASGVPGFGPPTAGAGLRPPAPGAAGAGRIGGFAGPGGVGGSSSTLKAAVAYAKAHGGGTIGVESQGTAASLILSENANVAGLGGFSGRESTVSATWLAQEVRSGHLRWIVAEQSRGARLPGDTRTGSQSALSVVESACPAVKLSTAGATASATMYDCQGRAAAILAAAAK
jgi:4-amino-4-deoxy-L-arabinose transferase-like glycosyltransferase